MLTISFWITRKCCDMRCTLGAGNQSTQDFINVFSCFSADADVRGETKPKQYKGFWTLRAKTVRREKLKCPAVKL